MSVNGVNSYAFEKLMAPFGGKKQRFAVALSGGADSLCLTLLLHQWAKNKNHQIIALTIDHGLRPESHEEATLVHNWMKNLGISHEVLTWEGTKPATRIQEIAREKRYDLLTNYCRTHDIRILMTAHHLDDQRETVLMRALKGSGVQGLAGIQPIHKRDGIILLRPLLKIPKSCLLETLGQLNHPWIEDPSNQTTQYERVRIRSLISHIPIDHLDRLQHVMSRWHALDMEYVTNWLQTHTRKTNEGFEIRPKSILFTAIGEPFWKHLIQQVGQVTYGPKIEALKRFVVALQCLKNGQRATLGRCVALKRQGIIFISQEKLRY